MPLLTFHIHLYNNPVIEKSFLEFWETLKKVSPKYLLVKEYGTTKKCWHYQGVIEHPEATGQNKEMKKLKEDLKGIINNLFKYRKGDTSITDVRKGEEEIIRYLLKDVRKTDDIIDVKSYEEGYLSSYFGVFKKKTEEEDWRKKLLEYIEDKKSLFIFDREDLEHGHYDGISLQWVPSRKHNSKLLSRQKLFELVCDFYKGNIYDRDLVRRYDYLLYYFCRKAYIDEQINRFTQFRSLSEVFISCEDIEDASRKDDTL